MEIMDKRSLLLDNRNSEDIYYQALNLAKYYCPEWAHDWGPDYFDPDDPGLVIFKLFSDMAEYSTKQFNRIPEKHFITFLDFMGIDLLPARTSIVPLTFYIAQGSEQAQIPSRTLVASSKDPEIIFETAQHLTAIPVKLFAFSINPVKDRYSDHSDFISGERTFSIFSNNSNEKRLDHILYLGIDDLFNGITPFQNIKIKLKGDNLSYEHFEQWYNGQGIPLIVEINKEQNTNDSLIFNFTNVTGFEKTTFNDLQNFWIYTRPNNKIRITPGSGLPQISNITVDIASEKIIPGSLFFDNVPLDIKKGLYPFGETPKEGCSFYIGSIEAFSREGSKITLTIELEKELENREVELSWEFRDGEAWKKLPMTKDNTDGFRKSGICINEFICPVIPESEINGQSNKWIRIRIESGGYGSSGKFEQSPLDDIINLLPATYNRMAIKTELEKKGVSFGIKYIESTYNPPFIKSIFLAYSFEDRNIKQVLSYNNFSYKKFNDSDVVVPFEPFGEERPIFYLGFEKILTNIQISLFVSIKEKPDERSVLIWKYYDGDAWKELPLENDETDSFNKSGIVSFMFSQEIKKSLQFGKEYFWIRIESHDGLVCPEINGIFPNTVWAFNQISIDNEILGSGNGLPGQSFSFSKKPVLPGQVIEIKEGENLLEWKETCSFVLSGKKSRDYIIDRIEGRIFFGDGIHGMTPPKGKNNIIAKSYRSGSGKKGNLKTGAIDTLRRANPDIERVTNHVPSSGGIDNENVDGAVFRGPHAIKNRGYAVTVEDFEWLAREASPEVIRTKAFLDDTNRINVIILNDRFSDTRNEKPFPEKSLIDSVGKYIKERALFNIQERIYISGPEYKRIDIDVVVKPLLINESSLVIEKLNKELMIFFDPVRGGKYGNGYDFGEKLFVSDVSATIENVDGVDYVEEIILKKIIGENIVDEVSAGGWINMENNALPYPGNIEITITK